MNTQAQQHAPTSRWRIDGRIVAAYAFLFTLMNVVGWWAGVPGSFLFTRFALATRDAA